MIVSLHRPSVLLHHRKTHLQQSSVFLFQLVTGNCSPLLVSQKVLSLWILKIHSKWANNSLTKQSFAKVIAWGTVTMLKLSCFKLALFMKWLTKTTFSLETSGNKFKLKSGYYLNEFSKLAIKLPVVNGINLGNMRVNVFDVRHAEVAATERRTAHRTTENGYFRFKTFGHDWPNLCYIRKWTVFETRYIKFRILSE